jgi:hypothetical protein
MRPACCNTLATTVTDRAAHAEHLRQELVGKLDGIAFEPIARLQQPTAQARLYGVQCVAGRSLLDLNKQDLAVLHDDPADGLAFLRGVAKMRGRNAQGSSPHLHHGARVGAPHAEACKRADPALVADGRGLDRVAVPHHGQQRDDPVVREIDLIDAVALLLQDHALLQHHLLQMGREQCEVLRRQRRQ